MKKSIDVVGAVLLSQDKILCAQRGPQGSLAGQWEFPGGKVEVDETPRQALEREIAEELRCSIRVGQEITTTRHEYAFAIVNLTTFWCDLTGGTPQLTEHSAVRWLAPDELTTLTWAPADMPSVEHIQSALR